MQDGDEIDAMLHQSKRAIGRNVPRYGFLIAVLTGDRNLLRRGSQQLEATKIQTIGNRNACDFEFPSENALQPLPARPLHLELPPTAKCASYLHHAVKICDPLLSVVDDALPLFHWTRKGTPSHDKGVPLTTAGRS